MAIPGENYRPASQREEHNRLYQEALDLVWPHLPLHQQPEPELSDATRAQLRRGVELFRRVLTLKPDNWNAMWTCAMTLRRLGELAPALELFAAAARICGDNPDVPREAGITAMELGRYADAITFTEQAIRSNPKDPGLVANLALAYLLNQNPPEARRAAAYAVEADPADEISRRILAMIDDVLANKRPCPRHPREF